MKEAPQEKAPGTTIIEINYNVTIHSNQQGDHCQYSTAPPASNGSFLKKIWQLLRKLLAWK